MRAFDRDLIRGGHYGQRSCEPHSKAEHMAAPTNAALVRKALPTRSRPHMALSCRADQRLSRQLSGVKQTRLSLRRSAANDAVDGAHSTASMCQRVVALKRTTLRGAVYGRG